VAKHSDADFLGWLPADSACVSTVDRLDAAGVGPARSAHRRAARLLQSQSNGPQRLTGHGKADSCHSLWRSEHSARTSDRPNQRDCRAVHRSGRHQCLAVPRILDPARHGLRSERRVATPSFVGSQRSQVRWAARGSGRIQRLRLHRPHRGEPERHRNRIGRTKPARLNADHRTRSQLRARTALSALSRGGQKRAEGSRCRSYFVPRRVVVKGHIGPERAAWRRR
jgi:hypothetical protein